MQMQMANAATTALSALRPWWGLPLIAVSVLLILAGLGVGLWWLLVYRKRQQLRQSGALARSVDSKRLTRIWEQFLSNLPGAARAAVPSRPHFIVLGEAGSGKSTLIQRKVDWQGQANQFLPSYVADPLLQIYLGSKTVVQELAGALLESTSRATNEALRRLYSKLDIDHPPTVILVLKVSSLTTATPDQLRQQAQVMRGKINLLSERFGRPIPTRICLTHMERTHGYAELARFLKRNKLPLELMIGSEVDLVAGLQAYEKHMPRALITLPVAAFQSNIEFLLSAEDALGPVGRFISALREGSLTAAGPELQRVYFFSPSPDEQISNPFDLSLPPTAPARSLAWLRRWLQQLGIQPLHLALGSVLLLGGLLAVFMVTRRHAALVDRAAVAAADLEAIVRRSQEARSSPSESEAVRRGEQAASRALSAIGSAEARFRPLRLLFRPEKSAARQRFVEAVRAGYLLPELERAVRQRSRERILYALAAIYATNGNTLGALVRAQSGEWAAMTGVSADILLDYIRYSEEPWRELALRLLPPLPSESSRWPVSDLRPWREFVLAVVRAVPLPYITPGQLKDLQQQADKLIETLAQVRRASVLRQLFRALSEESPMDMVRLLGRDAGALVPHPWIVDHAEPMEKLLALIRGSSLQLSSGGGLSLFRLLKWINELSSGSGRLVSDGKQLEDEIYYLPFPDEKPLEVSRRAWLELLLRSRKRLLLAYQISTATPSRHSHHNSKAGCCGCAQKPRRVHRAKVCKVDPEERWAPRATNLPLWNREELTPKLTALLNGDDTPSQGLDELYSRQIFEKEVLPLVQELKRALQSSKTLTPEEKLQLSRLVQSEVGGYAHHYCAALRRFYLSYEFAARSPAALHSELLNLVNPGSPFLAHLRAVADNVVLPGLAEPYLRTLAQCLAELQPIASVVYPENDGAVGVAPAADKGAGNSGPPEARRLPGRGVPEGLRPYKDAVAKLVSELDGSPARPERGTPLSERLGPLGKSALATLEGGTSTPRSLAEKFLDDAGISGELRHPFMSPFSAAYRSGAEELERALAQHWSDELLPQVAPLFTRFPFNRAAEREVAPAELDALSEPGGTFFRDLRAFYAPVLGEQGGVYQQKPGDAAALKLPRDLLPTVNRLAHLARALFRADGSRQPLRLTIRGLPGPVVQEDRATQSTSAFIQVGRAAVYGFNQQPEAAPIVVPWWEQGVSVVGVERTNSRTGRRQTQSIEVADSAWSLFRLLQKSTLDSDGVSTWRLLAESRADTQILRFVIQPDPWALFQVQLP